MWRHSQQQRKNQILTSTPFHSSTHRLYSFRSLGEPHICRKHKQCSCVLNPHQFISRCAATAFIKLAQYLFSKSWMMQFCFQWMNADDSLNLPCDWQWSFSFIVFGWYLWLQHFWSGWPYTFLRGEMKDQHQWNVPSKTSHCKPGSKLILYKSTSYLSSDSWLN